MKYFKNEKMVRYFFGTLIVGIIFGIEVLVKTHLKLKLPVFKYNRI